MNKQELIQRLKSAKGVKIVGNYIHFDKESDLDFQVLSNFKLRELLTKNTTNTFTILSIDVLVMLNEIRQAWGASLFISSSYRSRQYNKSVKGATLSQHIIGNALDILPVLGRIKEFQRFIQLRNINGGVGYYNTFVHIDVGQKRIWDERK